MPVPHAPVPHDPVPHDAVPPHRSAPYVIVLGAGLTGLVTAWQLRQRGIAVTVLEAGAEPGGVMQSSQRDGFLVEHGPNSCTLTAAIAQLVHALDLTAHLREAAPQARRRFIVRAGVPLEVPMSPPAMLRSPLFGAMAKLRVLAEPFVGRRTQMGDESVADFVRRRLGAEPLAWAVDPFVSGVYAGDPEHLSVRHAFPRLAALEREHGSLVRGMIASARRARGVAAPSAHTMISFRDGMATLPRAIAASLGPDVVRCGHRARMVEHDGLRYTVTVDTAAGMQKLAADVVISTLPLHALTQVQLPQGAGVTEALAQLALVPYPPVSSLALGFRRRDVAHALDGFGCLIPSAERRDTLGVLFSSTLFDGRAPDGHVLLTCFIGGTRHPEHGALTTDALVARVLADLRALLGITGEPAFVQHTAWPHAIPQYNLGHDANVQAATALEAALPGLLVDGQFRRGVSVGDCVASGEVIAERAVALVTALALARGHAPALDRGAGLDDHATALQPVAG